MQLGSLFDLYRQLYPRYRFYIGSRSGLPDGATAGTGRDAPRVRATGLDTASAEQEGRGHD